jgi:hypothetical protein
MFPPHQIAVENGEVLPSGAQQGDPEASRVISTTDREGGAF